MSRSARREGRPTTRSAQATRGGGRSSDVVIEAGQPLSGQAIVHLRQPERTFEGHVLVSGGLVTITGHRVEAFGARHAREYRRTPGRWSIPAKSVHMITWVTDELVAA